MSEEMNTEVPVETPTGDETPQSNLPSDIADNTIDSSKWEINDSLKERFKDGKLIDRFDSVESLLDGYQEMAKKHANYVRDVKEGAKADEASIETIQAEREASNAKNEAMADLVKGMLDNGMQVTEDMQASLDEHGIDVRDVKLSAIDNKDAVSKAYASVGGKEEYEAMQSWAKENLPDNVRLDYDKNLLGASADIYIQGLYSQYKASGSTSEQTENAPQPTRISGETTSSGVARGYTTRAEMLKDVNYINGKGKNDAGALKAHRERLSRTSDEVVYG